MSGRPLRGAAGFLTRLPIATDETDWHAFAASPWTFPVVGILVGALVALPLLLPDLVGALGFVVAVYALIGINHADGLADLGDAAVVHGDAERRRAVLKDSAVGVGALVAVGLGLVGLTLAAVGLARLPWPRALALAVAAEVGAKAGMATLACLGRAGHEGFASAFTGRCSPTGLVGVAAATLPVIAAAALLAPEVGLAALAALLSALAVAIWLGRWADANLGGVTGDVFGAANELGRVAALHAGLLLF
ncbi:adenosylcobinamide-GDP ribazoletransferase [Halosegnis sp.]|uniref:adenosylcobinamide-GDP ribazoletransferase n=1 Tax=Halosegnis sp. TaxID=2864959 RepID=UPI0035D516B7